MDDDRAGLSAIFDGIPPLDDVEARHHAYARHWLRSGAPLHRVRKPDVPKVHLVVYFMVADPVRGELLLADHRAAGLWLPPGGHVEASDAGPWATVRRECPEEIRIEAVPLEATGPRPFFATVTRTRGAGPHTDVSLWYALRAEAGEVGGVGGYDAREFAAIAWMTPRQVLDAPPETLDPNLPRAVRKFTALT